LGSACGMYGWEEKCIQVLVEEIKPLTRSRRKWEGVFTIWGGGRGGGTTWTGFILLRIGTNGGLL